jgi:hypothetical protein
MMASGARERNRGQRPSGFPWKFNRFALPNAAWRSGELGSDLTTDRTFEFGH